MEKEEKAKVVASGWGAEFCQFFAALAVLPRSIWYKTYNSSFSSKSTETKQLPRQEVKKFGPPNRGDDLCLCFSLHPSSMPRWQIYCPIFFIVIVTLPPLSHCSITSTELRAIWSVLAAIYHLGVAGVTQYTMGRAGFAKSQASTVHSLRRLLMP